MGEEVRVTKMCVQDSVDDCSVGVRVNQTDMGDPDTLDFSISHSSVQIN